ncbi:MFS transporter [Kitasatospora sp. NPDC057500]|uniref:MFS transporter n=1 Tax=Kitasatospora sp. NPDC057500 TaxID=3346151 RepID=UPI0036AB2A32
MADRPKGRITAALRHRDFALLWSGQLVSLAGDGIFTVALPLEVLRRTGRAFDLGIVVTARTVPAVLLLLAGGALVDRLSRRLVMLVSDLCCALAVGLVAVLMATGRAGLWELAALSAVFGVASAFFKPASSAVVPEVLPAELLVSAGSLSSLSHSVAKYLLGPLAGGVLVAAIGNTWAFGLNAVSFAASAVCLALMRRTPRPEPSGGTLLDGIREGLRYCRSVPWLWWSMIAVGIANITCYAPITVLLPVLVKDVFHGGAVALGALFAAGGVGGALAAASAGRRPPRRRMTAIWAAWSGVGAATVALALAPWVWLSAVFTAAAWFGMSYGNILWYSLMQRELRPEMLGRAASVDSALSLALTPLGTLVGGAAAGLVDVRLTLVVGGLATAGTAAVLLVPGVREPDRPAHPTGSRTLDPPGIVLP